jgi:hypothetical protein
MISAPINWMIGATHVLSVIVIGIGVRTIVWYIAGSPPQEVWWHTNEPMTVETGLAFAMAGSAIFLITTAVDRHLRKCHGRG